MISRRVLNGNSTRQILGSLLITETSCLTFAYQIESVHGENGFHAICINLLTVSGKIVGTPSVFLTLPAL